MDIKLEDLRIFTKVYEIGTFTQASKKLGLTQSALSQKIAKIEDILQSAVFVRHPRQLELTASGEKLLLYAKEAISMHDNFITNFEHKEKQLSGVIRIAAFSSILRSMIIPKLAPLIEKNPHINIEFASYEVYELENILKSNKADLIFTDYEPLLAQIEKYPFGYEEYIVISAKNKKNIPHKFLDHGPFDNATETYFKFQKLKQDYTRGFLGDVYSIIDGVALGLGKAVMSKHLVKDDKRFDIIEHKKSYKRKLYFSHFKQNYYSPLHKEVISILSN